MRGVRLCLRLCVEREREKVLHRINDVDFPFIIVMM